MGFDKERRYLDQAIRGYERGFYLRNDYYNGINYAFLLNVRAVHGADFAESIADFVQARRVRLEVITICEQWLAENPPATTPMPENGLFDHISGHDWESWATSTHRS